MSQTGFIDPIQSYDFHIYYYDLFGPSKAEAIQLKNKIFEDFQKEIDDDELVIKVLRDEARRGPHVVAFFEVDIENPVIFTRFFSWIQYHHGSLSVLVHPNSGDFFKDHTHFAGWIGTKLPLLTDILKDKYGYPDFAFPKREVINDGFYKDPAKYSKSIMIRLIEVGDKEKLWS